MAQTFGQLLAGAGRVATGMREEQEAQRVAQLNEMYNNNDSRCNH